jgi:O-antigen ligase/polysaccharide polymerase Wzy-like membrane protein
LAFFLFLFYLGLNFLRPAELYPSLEPYHIMDVAIVLAGLAVVGAIVLGRAPNLRVPQPFLVAAFTGWAMLSLVLAERWPGGALFVLTGLAPSLALFALFYLNLDSLARVRVTCTACALLGLVTAAQSVYSYHTGWRAQTFLFRQREDDPDEVVPYQVEQSETDEDAPEGAPAAANEPADTPAYIVRIRNLGFLQDPNDLAQTLVSFLPLLVASRAAGRRWRNALLTWLPVAAIMYAIALTRSRGSIIALGVLLYLALRPRLGQTFSIVLGLLGAAAAIGFGFAGGRALTVDQSAEGRLEAWAEGLEMLKASPVWGVGWGQFTEHHPLVAHNSFVHCFSETGLVGYFLWLATITLTIAGLRRVTRSAPQGEAGDEVRRWSRAAELGLIAFLTGAFFLSRSYSVVLFLLLGLGTAVMAVARREEWYEPGPGVGFWGVVIAALTVTSVFGFWLLMKALS